MRNPAPGPVVDPDLVWWRSCGPVSVRREPAPPEEVCHRVREEDDHVRHYMAAMEVRFSNTWQVLRGSQSSYDPVMVPSLWVSTARASGTASELDYSIVFDPYQLASDVFDNIRDVVFEIIYYSIIFDTLYSRLYILFDNIRDDVFEIILDDAHYVL